jgi:hypothetical protein
MSPFDKSRFVFGEKQPHGDVSYEGGATYEGGGGGGFPTVLFLK